MIMVSYDTEARCGICFTIKPNAVSENLEFVREIQIYYWVYQSFRVEQEAEENFLSGI